MDAIDHSDGDFDTDRMRGELTEALSSEELSSHGVSFTDAAIDTDMRSGTACIPEVAMERNEVVSIYGLSSSSWS